MTDGIGSGYLSSKVQQLTWRACSSVDEALKMDGISLDLSLVTQQNAHLRTRPCALHGPWGSVYGRVTARGQPRPRTCTYLRLAYRLSISTGAVQAVNSCCNWRGIYVDVRERILKGRNSPWHLRPRTCTYLRLAYRLSASTGAVQAVNSCCNWHGIYVDVRERILEGCSSPWYLRPCYGLCLHRRGMAKWVEQPLPGQPERRQKSKLPWFRGEASTNIGDIHALRYCDQVYLYSLLTPS